MQTFGKKPNTGMFGEKTNRGIVHQFIFYRSDLIFWIVMGCGIADFGWRGLKTPQTPKLWSRILSPGVSTRSATWGFD